MYIALIIIIIIAFLSTITIRTIRFKPEKTSSTETLSMPENQSPEHLAKIISFKTISYPNVDNVDWEEFQRLHSWLKEAYPLVHEHLELEMIGGYTLHYTWKGTSSDLEPILLLAHQDVVPTGEDSGWEHGPFSGDIDDMFIWGRGTLDVKIQIIGILEAIEALLIEGFTPQRSIHLCFGHDEEVGGYHGASAAVELFKERGLRFAYVLDEGGAVSEGMIKGIDKPIATIGIGEKGYLDIEIKSLSPGGHSSMPMPHTALSRIAKAITRLQKHPMPLRLEVAPSAMFKVLGPHMSLTNRIVLANLWIFKPLFLSIMSKNNTSNSMIRTTIASTMASGSGAANVLPTEATAILNIRLLHGDTVESVVEYIKKVIDDPQVSVTPLREENPSHLSPVEGKEFSLIKNTVAKVFTDAIIAPYLMVGGSDARKYEAVSDKVYRFGPYQLPAAELGRMHSYNERISIDNVKKGCLFYEELIKATNEL